MWKPQPEEAETMSNPRRKQPVRLTFPEGLVGYPEWKHFTLEESPDGVPVGLLQSREDAEVFFLVTRPELVCPSYAFGVPDSVRDLLGLSIDDEPIAMCILVVRQNPLAITANLLGPIVYNPLTGLACQVVLDDSPYSSRHPMVVPEGVPAEGS